MGEFVVNFGVLVVTIPNKSQVVEIIFIKEVGLRSNA